jgi:meso-butanediol dehydrogenase/(S,S)-butanediol dehydrogenase/diacetyl reductase
MSDSAFGLPGRRLAGRRVLITGTASGQGEAAVALFAREGARIESCDIKEGEAEAQAEQLRGEGYDVNGETLDLGDAEATSLWVEGAASRLEGIDVLYNNGAAARMVPFAEMSLETWRWVIHHELDIIFHTTHPAWEHLRRSGSASVINTASMSGIVGIAPLGQAAHAAAKGGVIGLTKTLAAEGAADGIRVNAISPGLVRTPSTEQFVGDELRAFQLGMHLIRREGTPTDIAYLALYLASEEAAWVTGQNYSIDGGVTAGFR